MRYARTLKSRIAAINKQIGALPGLVTLKIKTPEGKLEALSLEPIDAVIALVDEMLEKFSRQTEAIMPKDELTFRAVADMMVENARLVVDDARGRAFFMLMRTQIRWGEESMHGVREELLTNQRFGPWHAFIRAVENDKAAGRARAGVDAMEVANMCVSLWDGMVQGRIDGFLRTDMCLNIRHAFDAVWEYIKA